ncbi:hypothetical protein PIF93_002475 [Enterococcus hirae]|uniref:putative holin-like toxin n=1 Tax=Enterococcus TaxID=1350 RepID=UPI0009BEB5FC|nr:putative holin-like toxin [Enterococcus hirae]EMF0042429.1 hypothetical protein [Enterococcus hirae]EMF0137072.1 hypothetical protein [Enterococcus hirae]EMF0511253.1 hypothetical protein [Enterococcus hirae]EMF0621758.1 hypothetical protein [Enterococcus hirae]OQO39672.1 hypothetical protein BH758_14360 [Enterococcus hirae]
MSTFEAIQLMIAFATLVLLIIDHKDPKKQPSNHFGRELDGSKHLFKSHRLFNGSTWGYVRA